MLLWTPLDQRLEAGLAQDVLWVSSADLIVPICPRHLPGGLPTLLGLFLCLKEEHTSS